MQELLPEPSDRDTYMLKRHLFILSCVLLTVSLPQATYAQSGTEVYLFDLNIKNGRPGLSTPMNISANPGYDNQPSFSPDGRFLLYASTRSGNTDILLYDIENYRKTWLSETPGGEYSPQFMPDGRSVAAVRLDPDGFQRLYAYDMNGGEPQVLLPGTVTGYYAQLDSMIYSFVLGNPATFEKQKMYDSTSVIIADNPGRSVHKVPGKPLISFQLLNENNEGGIYRYNPATDSVSYFAPMPANSLDMAWIDESSVLSGVDSVLYHFSSTLGDSSWVPVSDFSEWNLKGITRIAVAPGLDRIAVVVDE